MHLWRYFWAKILRDDCALNQLIFPSQPHTPIEWQIHCQTNGLLSITFTTNKSGLLCLGSVSGCLAIFSAFYDFFTDRKTQSSHEHRANGGKSIAARDKMTLRRSSFCSLINLIKKRGVWNDFINSFLIKKINTYLFSKYNTLQCKYLGSYQH